jgi:hypothetical protein
MRSLAVLVAAALGLAAVCLVVFGTTQKQLQIGVLLGLWGGLIGAFLIFGARRGQVEQSVQLAEAEQRVRELHEAQVQLSELQQAQLAAAEENRVRQEVEQRKLGEVQLSREVAARREADLHLELTLRREIERMMNDQIGRLREEVAALRAEVVDKLGGQLRLERIETTRLIGSDLEALQHEIRRLASQESVGGPAHSIGSAPPQLTSGRYVPVGRADWNDSHEVVESQPVAGWSEPTVVRAEPAPSVRAEPAPSVRAEPAPSVRAEPARDPSTPAAESRPAESRPAESRPAESRPAASRPAEPVIESAGPVSEPTGPADEPASDPFDLFAGLPRLTPLPADVELIPDTPAANLVPERQRPAGYHGRRRAAEDEEDQLPSGGGRRRAPDDAPDDLFARLRRS